MGKINNAIMDLLKCDKKLTTENIQVRLSEPIDKVIKALEELEKKGKIEKLEVDYTNRDWWKLSG